MVLRVVLCLLAFPLLGSVLLAQTGDSLRRLEVGVGGGVLLHELEFLPSDTVYGNLQRNNYALMLRYFDNKLVGFQAEVGIVEAGWSQEIDARLADYERRLRFIDLQLFTQLSIGNRAFQPLLQAGPYLSVPIADEQRIPEGGQLPQEYLGEDLPFRLNYGAQVGLGFNLTLGPVTLQADGRYLLGFTDVIPTRTGGVISSRRRAIGGHAALLLRL